MSKEQYDLTRQTNYLKRKMFLDPEGPVTVQRFEEVKYSKIAKFEELARGFFGYQKKSVLLKTKWIIKMPVMQSNTSSLVTYYDRPHWTVYKGVLQVRSSAP